MRKRLVFIISSVFLLFFSCKRVEKHGTIELDVSALFYRISYEYSASDYFSEEDAVYGVNLDVSGGFRYSYSFEGKLSDFEDKVIKIENIPLGSDVFLYLETTRNGEICYKGLSSPKKITAGENFLDLLMERVSRENEFSVYEKYSSPIIEITQGDISFSASGEIMISGKSEVSFQVQSGTGEDYPDETKCYWYLNRNLISGFEGKNLVLNLSKAEYVSLGSNNVQVIISDRGKSIMGSADINFIVKM